MRSLQALTFIVTAFLTTLPAHAQSGGGSFAFRRYQEVTEQGPAWAPTSEAMVARTDWQQRQLRALTEDVGTWFDLYLRGGQLPEREMVEQMQRDPFVASNVPVLLNTVAKERTLQALTRALRKDPLALRIAAWLDENRLAPLRFHLFERALDPDTPAGFQRGTRTVFFYLKSVDPRDWFTIFVHEFCHALDSNLEEGIRAYHAPESQARVHEWVLARKTDFSRPQRKWLRDWFAAGAERGLFAEWRAWVVSTIYTQKLLKAGLLQQVPPILAFFSQEGLDIRQLSRRQIESAWWDRLRALEKPVDDPLLTAPNILTELNAWSRDLKLDVSRMGGMQDYLR